MKRVALVAGHFTPGNLASVHRARLWARHLGEFGWEPTIVTTHYRHYEEPPDWDLDALVARDLRVIRTRALPLGPVRLIGDIGLRALPFHHRALARLARQGEMDFLHITIPSNYAALLGRLIHGRYGVPYGIDYIDPWVGEWPGTDVRFSRMWASAQLARRLEPWAVRDAALITGVAPLYYEDVLARNPHLRTQAVTAAMPYGGSALDFSMVEAQNRPTTLFDATDGNVHIVYAGAMLPRAYAVLERLFEAVRLARSRYPELAARLRMHFVGTGKSPTDPHGHNVLPYVERFGLGQVVFEHPARVPYVDVLNHLRQSSGVLVLGSTERHYTPSKAFQAVLSRKPVFAVLHDASTAAAFLRDAHAGTVTTFDEGRLPPVEALADALEVFVLRPDYAPDRVNWAVCEAHSARASAKALAAALDEVLARRR
ncbi:MAG TPA: hypothetical protein VMM93_14635 [Vicinamibacterales bacterium]|nr:hypothetical protein [Vicinamibacterales bacterium]